MCESVCCFIYVNCDRDTNTEFLRVKETNMKIIEYQVIMVLFNYFVVYVSNQIN